MTMYYTFFVVVILLSLTHGAPQRQRHRRHPFYSSHEEHRPKALEWVSPCGTITENTSSDSKANTTTTTTPPPKMKTPLKALREFIPNSVIKLNDSQMNAIDTHDVHEWFNHNATYSFLRQINVNSTNITLRKWHVDTQVYVGAFGYLLNKQTKYDRRRNEGNAKSTELKGLLRMSKLLLCEIEQAINNTRLKMPPVHTRDSMKQELNFRNNKLDRNKYDEVDDIDSKFTKMRFHEYLHNLDRIMKRPRRKHVPCKNRKNKRKNLCGKRDVEDEKRNSTSIVPSAINEIGNRNPLHRRGHRVRNGNGLLDGGARPNHTDENGNHSHRPHRCQRQRGNDRRHRNPLNKINNQIADGSTANGLQFPLCRNRRKHRHRAIDLSSTDTTTIFAPFSMQ